MVLGTSELPQIKDEETQTYERSESGKLTTDVVRKLFLQLNPLSLCNEYELFFSHQMK